MREISTLWGYFPYPNILGWKNGADHIRAITYASGGFPYRTLRYFWQVSVSGLWTLGAEVEIPLLVRPSRADPMSMVPADLRGFLALAVEQWRGLRVTRPSTRLGSVLCVRFPASFRETAEFASWAR
jgi:hypothetical protein